jgi:hypothetical protein
MPRRTVKFVSAILAGILAGTALATTSRGETVAPDDCLSTPKGETPQGAHWHYRIEHGTKRHCWYLRQEGERLSQASPQNILPPVKPPAPAAAPANPAPQRPLADARAELQPQPNRDDALTAAAPTAAVPANEVARLDGSGASASSAVLATRWPEPAASPPASPQTVQSDQAANMPADSTVSPAPVDAAVIPADADSSSYAERGIMPLLVAILGAFTLGAAIIFNFGRPRRRQPRKVRVRRGPIWETTDDDRIVLSDHPGTNAHLRRPRFARGSGEAEDRKSESHRRQPRRARA